jgi:hypothetical protein
MQTKLVILCIESLLILLVLGGLSAARSVKTQNLGGTLVVAVPVTEGLVACSDKRLFNDQTGTFDDNFVKIREVDNNTLFVATHTVGFLDKTTGKFEFNVFEITDRYVLNTILSPGNRIGTG